MSKTDEPGRVPEGQEMSHEKQVEMAKALKDQGHTVGKIAYVMRISESSVRVLTANVKHNIWYPDDDYEPREDDKYGVKLAMLEPGEVVFLVRKRVDLDLDVAVPNGFMGEEKEKMRDLMLYVVSHKNVMICLHGVAKAHKQDEYTVDWVCRELGKQSRALLNA